MSCMANGAPLQRLARGFKSHPLSQFWREYQSSTCSMLRHISVVARSYDSATQQFQGSSPTEGEAAQFGVLAPERAVCRKQLVLFYWHVSERGMCAVGAWGDSQSPEGGAELPPRQSSVEPLPMCAWSADHVNKVTKSMHGCPAYISPYHAYGCYSRKTGCCGICRCV